jgi:hypothetical protein
VYIYLYMAGPYRDGEGASSLSGTLGRQTLTKRYVLGTDTEGMAFAGEAIEYGPFGERHVVDTESAGYQDGCTVAYAVCGQPVRAWPDQPVDVDHLGEQIHDGCARLVTTGQRSRR